MLYFTKITIIISLIKTNGGWNSWKWSDQNLTCRTACAAPALPRREHIRNESTKSTYPSRIDQYMNCFTQAGTYTCNWLHTDRRIITKSTSVNLASNTISYTLGIHNYQSNILIQSLYKLNINCHFLTLISYILHKQTMVVPQTYTLAFIESRRARRRHWYT